MGHRHPRTRGSLKGKIVLEPDWDSDQVNNEIASDFEGEPFAFMHEQPCVCDPEKGVYCTEIPTTLYVSPAEFDQLLRLLESD